jgi:nucleoside-triphosphatase THEP1
MLLVNESKVVEVFGFSGVGKSTVVRKVAHFLADRNIYEGGIIYANLTGFNSS